MEFLAKNLSLLVNVGVKLHRLQNISSQLSLGPGFVVVGRREGGIKTPTMKLF